MSTTRRETALVALASVLVTGLWWLDAAARGAVGALRGDDWVYLRAVQRWAETGVFAPDFSMAMLVGQVLLAWPVVALAGLSVTALQALTSLVGAATLTASYLVVRSFLPRIGATLATACLALGPLYPSLAVSFMSDLYMTGLAMLSLLLGIQATRRPQRSLAWLAGALLAALAAFSVREYGLAAGAAATAVVCWQALRRRQWGTVLAATGLGLATVGVAVGLLVWRRSVPGSFVSQNEPWPAAYTASMVTRLLVTLGLFVLPAALLLRPRALALRQRWWRAALVGLLLAAVALAGTTIEPVELLRNYTAAVPSYSETIPGTAGLIMPRHGYDLLVAGGAVGLLAAGVGLSCARRRLSDPALVALAWVLGYGVGLVAIQGLTGNLLFDRYLMPLVVPVAGLLAYGLRGCGARAWSRLPVLASLGLAALAALGLLVGDAAAANDGVKHRVGSGYRSEGYPAATVDAGYEWFGFYQPGPWGLRPAQPGEPWYWSLYPPGTVCVRLSYDDGSILPGQRLVESVTATSLSGYELRYRVTVPVETPAGCPVPAR
ncbi:MAG: hypothetical protein Q4G45_04395 [Actinomycetia bacterium]|nr:hypothetical protein [Actinomycetes bacterium]